MWNRLYSEESHGDKHTPYAQLHHWAIQYRKGFSSGAFEIYEVPFLSTLEILVKITEECVAKFPNFRHIQENQIRYFTIQIL